MKKIIVMIIFLLCCTGCYDYNELNNMAIVVAFGIDWENDEYKITYEVLNDNVSSNSGNSSGSESKPSFLVSGTGTTIIDAIQDTSLHVAKEPFLMHVETIVFGEEVLKGHLDKIIDYLLRTPRLSDEFLSIVAKDTTAYDILNTKLDSPPVVADALVKLIENNENTANISAVKPFVYLISDGLSSGSDMVIPSIIKEDEKLKLQGLATFDDFELSGYLTFDESITYNLVNNYATNAIYKAVCKNDESSFILTAFYSSNFKIQAKDEKVLFKGELKGTVVESNCDYKLQKADIYLELEKDYEKIIKDSIINLIKSSQSYDSDFLSIGSAYYRKYRVDDPELFKSLKYDVDVHVLIDRKGLIYEVKGI